MELLTRTAKKFRSLRFGPLPCVMFLFMTVRTFLSGNAIMLSGLCVACLPFFAQLRNTSCKEPDVSEHKEIFSLYLFNLLLLTIGMLYLRGLTFLGSLFMPAMRPVQFTRIIFTHIPLRFGFHQHYYAAYLYAAATATHNFGYIVNQFGNRLYGVCQ